MATVSWGKGDYSPRKIDDSKVGEEKQEKYSSKYGANPSDELNIGSWLSPVASKYNAVEHIDGAESIWREWHNAPSMVIGQANISESYDVKLKFCKEMDECSDKAIAKFEQISQNGEKSEKDTDNKKFENMA